MPYLKTFFEQVDCLLCALFGGRPDTTISLTAARAEVRGERWGCVLCAWLHATLRQRHCMRTLDGEPMSGFAQVSAAVQIAAVFVVVFYGIPLAARAFL